MNTEQRDELELFAKEDWTEMERFVRDRHPLDAPDAEDCERFTSRYGRRLITAARRLEQAEREREELKGANERLSALGRVMERERDEALSRSQSLQEEVERLRGAVKAYAFSTNEWADAFYNAVQWIKNLRDGIGGYEDALANLADCAKHCQEEWAKAHQALTAADPKTGGEG